MENVFARKCKTVALSYHLVTRLVDFCPTKSVSTRYIYFILDPGSFTTLRPRYETSAKMSARRITVELAKSAFKLEKEQSVWTKNPNQI